MPSTNRPSSSRRTSPWASSATARRCAVGPRQPGRLDEVGQAERAVLDGGKHGERLVEHADTAYPVFHKSRLSSQIYETQVDRDDHSGGPRMAEPTHAEREDVGRPRRPRPAEGEARPALHRSAPRARGDLAAGVRRPAHERPHGASARPHRRHRGPQRPDHRHRPAHRRSDLAQAGRGAAGQLRRVRHHASTRWATPARASCTSSAPSRASPSRA